MAHARKKSSAPAPNPKQTPHAQKGPPPALQTAPCGATGAPPRPPTPLGRWHGRSAENINIPWPSEHPKNLPAPTSIVTLAHVKTHTDLPMAFHAAILIFG